MYITTQDQLERFCQDAADSAAIAVDTEFIRERTFFPQLCLVQVATHELSATIDPLALGSLQPLAALMSNPQVVKVMHACAQDLEVLNDALGFVPAPVFDTQLAASFLGMRLQVGYAALVDSYTGVHLPKAESLTDWSKRPLDAEQLRYAEDDVRFLPDIYDTMMTQLVARKRMGWLEPEMAELTDPARYVRDPREAYLHLKRSGKFTRRQLAISREVCAWRDEVAAKRNLPRRWILSDELVVETCKRAPKSVESLRRIRGTDQLSKEDTARLVDAVRRGVACPTDKLPPIQHRRQRTSIESDGVLDLMYAVLRIVSDANGIAPQLVATREDLLDFAQGREDARLAKGWRYDLAGAKIGKLLSGEIGLTVKDGHIELL